MRERSPRSSARRWATPFEMASALELAYGWAKAHESVEAFSSYTRTQLDASWDEALKLVHGLRAVVRFAVARDASFAERFPTIAKAYAAKKRPRKKANQANGKTQLPEKPSPSPQTSTAVH